MAASKCNYVVMYKNSSQIYSAATLKTAVNSPTPKGCDPAGRIILFITHLLDEQNLCVYPLTKEQIEEAEESNEQQKTIVESQE